MEEKGRAKNKFITTTIHELMNHLADWECGEYVLSYEKKEAEARKQLRRDTRIEWLNS